MQIQQRETVTITFGELQNAIEKFFNLKLISLEERSGEIKFNWFEKNVEWPTQNETLNP